MVSHGLQDETPHLLIRPLPTFPTLPYVSLPTLISTLRPYFISVFKMHYALSCLLVFDHVILIALNATLLP